MKIGTEKFNVHEELKKIHIEFRGLRHDITQFARDWVHKKFENEILPNINYFPDEHLISIMDKLVDLIIYNNWNIAEFKNELEALQYYIDRESE